jgi:hypothetical protein
LTKREEWWCGCGGVTKVKRGLLMKGTVVEESPKGLEKEREFVMEEVVVLKGVMTVCGGVELVTVADADPE